MGLLPIAEEGACSADTGGFPLFYMNDFSILGLRVQKLNDAIAALASDGYEIVATGGFARIRFDSRRHMAGIFKALSRRRIQYRMADLVSHTYQG